MIHMHRGSPFHVHAVYPAMTALDGRSANRGIYRDLMNDLNLESRATMMLVLC